MTEVSSGAHPPSHGGDDVPAEGPVIRDRRRLDPVTGQVRDRHARESGGYQGQTSGARDAGATQGATDATDAQDRAAAGEEAAQAVATDQQPTQQADQQPTEQEAAQLLADERLADLQRLQAEFLNYKRRVERDRDLARSQAVATVLESLLPVLDGIHAARQAGDLEGGPFAAIADKLEATLERFGLARFGEPGETFDPMVHEALVHTEAELAEGTTDPTVVQVLQPGYRTDERVLRAARVSVADPS